MVLKKVENTIREYALLQPQEKVLVACSGGADSVCLLHLLLELRESGPWEVCVCHFNHQLRKEAGKDEAFVQELALRHSLEYHSGSRDVKAYAQRSRLNLEEAGRELRYAFLKKTAAAAGAAKIATAHTMNDQAETFLMRLLRGSGLRGLAGIAPIRDDLIIRPMIQVERGEIETYLTERHSEYRVDKSNLDRRYLRNRIRMDLLPRLQQEYESQVVLQLGRLTELIRSEDEFLEHLVTSAETEVILKKDGLPVLDVEKLSQHPTALQRRLIRRYLERLRGNLRGISYEHVETIRRLKTGKEFPLDERFVLRRHQRLIGLKPAPAPRSEYVYGWDGSKSLCLAEQGIKIAGSKEKRSDSGELKFNNEALAALDFNRLIFPLIVRNRHEGDRYRPLGAPGRSKLKEIFRAKAIPVEERDFRPVFLSGEEIVWVQGLPVAHKFRITAATTSIFKIMISPLPENDLF
ncbi:MAG: tRNA lysidine(34) synthetase TilS [Candidatus Aminicenantes bacterium]|nr:tRNA lysidine(34) synthetase TilS [Candidatus Aminicenantes bacterium]